MTQFVCWVLFPVVLGLLSLGCGLLLEWAAGTKLPEGLLLPAGLAVIVVAAEVTTKTRHGAPFTTPAVVALALAGFALARPWRTRPRLGGWPLAAAGAVYLVYLAPVLLSGEPTFTGFIKLDDTATWMAMTDRVLHFGHDLVGLSPSTYWEVLHYYLLNGEPVGAMLPWGIGHQVVGQDLAWVFQPYLAFLAAMLALSCWTLVGPLVRSRPLRAAIVFVAAQAALIYGYSLWGGVKEVAAAALLALSAACAIPVFEGQARLRTFLPLGAASLALLGVLGWGGAVFLAVTLVAVGAVALVMRARKGARAQLAGFALLAVLLAVGLVRGVHTFLNGSGALTSGELGNLVHPLHPLQVFGIWPAADFRLDALRASTVAHLLIYIAIAALVVGLIVTVRARWWMPSIYVGAALIGVLLVSDRGSPWVQGKAFATASPAAVLVGLLGGAFLIDAPRGTFLGERTRRDGGRLSARRLVGAGLCGAIALGVLWSNALAYRHVSLAPYAQMRELQSIGDRFAGGGPTMINQFEPYATRHFLRAMTPEDPAELRSHQDPLLNGEILPSGGYADLDDFQLAGLLFYRTIVTPSSPVASRPPAPYRLVYSGAHYKVWQRPVVQSRPVVGSIPLGDPLDPTAVPSCRQVAALARRAGRRGLLAAASQPSPTILNVPSSLPYRDTTRTFAVRATGRYELWLQGSIATHLTTSVDGVTIGSTHEVVNEGGGWIPLGTIRLAAGRHKATLSNSVSSLAPGSGGDGGAPGPSFSVGPLAISSPIGDVPVTYVRPTDARSLCGKSWDWVEALGRPGAPQPGA